MQMTNVIVHSIDEVSRAPKSRFPKRVILVPADVMPSGQWKFWTIVGEYRVWRCAQFDVPVPEGAIDVPRTMPVPSVAQVGDLIANLTAEADAALNAIMEKIVALSVETSVPVNDLMRVAKYARIEYRALRQAMKSEFKIDLTSISEEKFAEVREALLVWLDAHQHKTDTKQLTTVLRTLPRQGAWNPRDFRVYGNAIKDPLWAAYGSSRYLWDAPVAMTLLEADNAGNLRVAPSLLICTVWQRGARWVYANGSPDTRSIERGSAASQAEAIIMARAHLWTEWTQRVSVIRKARGGVLSWGEQVIAPSGRIDIRLTDADNAPPDATVAPDVIHQTDLAATLSARAVFKERPNKRDRAMPAASNGAEARVPMAAVAPATEMAATDKAAPVASHPASAPVDAQAVEFAGPGLAEAAETVLAPAPLIETSAGETISSIDDLPVRALDYDPAAPIFDVQGDFHPTVAHAAQLTQEEAVSIPATSTQEAGTPVGSAGYGDVAGESASQATSEDECDDTPAQQTGMVPPVVAVSDAVAPAAPAQTDTRHDDLADLLSA